MVGTSRAPDDRTARFIAALHPVKGAEFPRHGAAADGDEIGIAFHASTKALSADINLDRRMDQLESEITLLRQAVSHLQKNNDKNRSGIGRDD